MENPRLVGAGALFIDDIVLPNGETHMGVLGGGVVHALMAAALWGERAGLCAFAGSGLPEGAQAHLSQFMDVRGLHRLSIPQARAWQVFEHDGQRRELHRVKDIAPFVAGTNPQHLPAAYAQAKAYFLLQDFNGIQTWADRPGIKLWEPNQLAILKATRDDLQAVLSNHHIDVISPNLEEAQHIYGHIAPDEIIDKLFEDGAQGVALRMGKAGSLVADAQTDKRHFIPIAPAQTVVDQTGAGNSYSGGLIAGLVQGYTLHEAAMMGAVAASFCLETFGVLNPATINPKERDRRYNQLLLSARARK